MLRPQIFKYQNLLKKTGNIGKKEKNKSNDFFHVFSLKDVLFF